MLVFKYQLSQWDGLRLCSCSCWTCFFRKGRSCDCCPLAATLSLSDLPLTASPGHLLFWMNALLNQAAHICIYVLVLSCVTGLYFMPPLWPIKGTFLSVWVTGFESQIFAGRFADCCRMSWFMWAWYCAMSFVIVHEKNDLQSVKHLKMIRWSLPR